MNARKAFVSPKCCSAENKHRAAFFAAKSSFSNCWKPYRENSTFSWLSCQLSLAKQCIYTDGFYSWVIHFILRGHFSTFGFRCESCAVHYISVTLSLQGQMAGGEFKSIRAWLPVTLTIALTQTYTLPNDMHIYWYTKPDSQTAWLWLLLSHALILYLKQFVNNRDNRISVASRCNAIIKNQLVQLTPSVV